MSEPEHSPLPWRDDGFAIKDAKDNTVCVYKFIGATEQHCANRRLIITAVNSHADLLAAAKSAFPILMGFLAERRTGYGAYKDLDNALAYLQTAIARAEQV